MPQLLALLQLIVAAIVGALAPGARMPILAAPAAGNVTIQPQPVYQGCNDLVVHADVGTPWQDVLAHFSDPSSVFAVWQFNNLRQRYLGIYFADPSAPTDGPSAVDVPIFAIFACVSHDGSVQ
ncbi:MAG TPA: hypothetical protein VFA70_11520 [Dehalococcoidia bacterium]|jgi:hypothetical protein|nr:hypothetical protein [Dehalococcoidia bacterium]